MDVKMTRPLIAVSPQWDREMSIYPDRIRVPMEDGKVVDYVLDIRQPHPSIEGAVETIRKWNQQDQGYYYQPKHEKRPSLWERIQSLRKRGE